jgi:hypothetical protein
MSADGLPELCRCAAPRRISKLMHGNPALPEKGTDMTTLVIDALLVLWILLFGGMALLPVLTGTTSARHQPGRQDEDRVISIMPARPTGQEQRRPLTPRDGHHDRTAA